MTLTDRASRAEESPWEDSEDIALESRCRSGEDLLVTVNLRASADPADYEFELYRGELPYPSERFRVEARGNVVQLTLQHASRDDAGQYRLVAKRLPPDNESVRLFTRRVHMVVDEPSFTEEGDPPLFLRRLTDLTVKVGTRTRFLVEIRSNTDPKVTWHRNDEPIQAGPRFSFVHEGNFYCVDVAPVTVEDQGHWTCMTENRSGRSSCTSHLNVLVPKAYKRPEFVSELRALLTETGTVSLECKVVGVPTPVLRWFKDDKEIKAGDVFALTANPDDPTSLGTYTCEATNCMGTSYSSSRVHVVGKGSREGSLKPADTLIVTGDPPIFKKILRDDSCRIGECLTLSCQVQVPPWPKEITWYNKEGRVEQGHRYKIIEDGLGGYSIYVNPVEAVDEGDWKCVATSTENVKQFTTCFVAMSIPKNYRKPRFMESLKAVLTEEGLVSFECKVVGFPTPLLRWFKDGQELKPGDVYQLTGTNSLGSYCCIAKNCMGEAKSTAELTVEDIQNQLNEEERLQLLTTNQPPKFIKGLRSNEAKISENFKFSVQVSIMPEPSLAWYRDDHPIESEDRYFIERETLGVCHLEIQKLEFCDQAEWKCVASNDFGQSITSCFLKLIIPKHYKKPKFLENLRAILSDGGAVNLECKVIGVPQPVLKWYKDGEELKPGDIHRIISGQDGTCCLGTYTCEATNCMGTVSSSASLLGFEDRVSSTPVLDSSSPIISQIDHERELARNLSLSTIHEERTSQLLDTAQTDHSVTLDDRGEVSFSFDGKEISVSLYETPDLTEEDALQIVEMYADQLSEHVTEHNIVELPPMRFTKETSTSGNLLMEAVVIDVSPDYFVSIEEGDDLRTEADLEDMSMMDGVSLSSPPTESIDDGRVPTRPPRRKSSSVSSKIPDLPESESYHSAKEPVTSLHHRKELDIEMDFDSEAFADALTSAHTKMESIEMETKSQKELRKRSISGGSSLDANDSSLDSASGMIKKKKKEDKKSKKNRRLGEKGSSEDSSIGVEDGNKSNKILETKLSLADDEEKSSLKTNKDRFIDLLRQISEPVLVVREALIDSEFLLEDANLINAFVTDNIVIPIQSLCELIGDIENKALKGAGDRSMTQNVRISILENIGGPTEELLRGLELIRRQENSTDIQTHISILESLVDPVDEIVFGLAKLEYELSGENFSESPVVLERTIRTTNRLGLNLKEVNNEIGTKMFTALRKIHETLHAYLDSITLNQFGGWTENIDAVLVESLARPLEELERESKNLILRGFPEESSELAKISDAFNELLSRLDALVVALEGYESDYRTNFVVNLKTSLVAAAEEISKSKSEKSESFDETHNLPEMILDTLIDAQASVNAVLHKAEEIYEEEGRTILQSSELVLSLAELRDAVSYAVHKTTTLKQDETINALINLKEPLIDLQISLSTDRAPEEIPMIENIIPSLNSLQKVVQTVIQHAENVEAEMEISDVIKPICIIVEELKQQIPMLLSSFKEDKIETNVNMIQVSNLDGKSAIQQTIDNLQMAAELSTVHFELATILEKCVNEIGNIESSPVFSKISELRQSIGSAAIEIDKISSKVEPNVETFVQELLELKEPLLTLQNILLTEDSTLEEQQIIVELLEPLERLKMVAANFAEEVIQTEAIASIVHLVDDIKKDITLHSNISIKNAVEQELNIKSESYSSVDFEHKGIQEKTGVETVQSSKLSEEKELIQTSIASELSIDHASEMQVDSLDQIQSRLDKITEKRVIYPKEEFAFVISQSLEEIQQDITAILEEFEQESVTTPHPVSRLAEALENLRRTISVVQSHVSQIALEISDVNSESSHAESYESAERISLSLKELLQPILEVREALIQTQDHRAPELLLLTRLDQPIRAIEFNVLQLALEAHSHTMESDETSSRASLDAMARALEDIESQIPVALDEVNSRQEILSILRNVSKPLEIIRERMYEISSDTLNEDNLELDITNILNEPLNKFRDVLNELFYRIGSTEYCDEKNKTATSMLKYLIEPLVELQSSLSVITSSRRSSIAEAGLLDERRNVILRAMEEVRYGIDQIRTEVGKIGEISALEKLIITSIDILDSAAISVQNQVSEANYARRRSCLGTLQERTVVPLQQLGARIATIEEQMDESALELILQPLETLSKQVQLAQIQFLQSSDQPLDEEAIIEGFLYPAKRLNSALETVKQSDSFPISNATINLLEELGESTSSFSSTLLALKNELIQEGANEKASIIETLTAVLVPFKNINQLINEISETSEKISESSEKISPIKTESAELADLNEKTSLIKEEEIFSTEEGTRKENEDDKVPTILTTVETIVDEFIEVSKRETESLTTLKFATVETLGENEKDYDDVNMQSEMELGIQAEQLTEQTRVQDSDLKISEVVESSTVDIVESAAGLITERRDSITVLWSLINEPLNNLQQTISLILDAPSVIESIRDVKSSTTQDHVIVERLTDLKISIAAMQQITTDDSEQITMAAWQETSLPILQNLAMSLEKLGEHLPMLANQSIIQESAFEEIPDNKGVANALKTLITPLQELRERLGLIVEEQMSYEPKLSEMKEESLIENKIKIITEKDDICLESANIDTITSLVSELTDKNEQSIEKEDIQATAVISKEADIILAPEERSTIVTEETTADESICELKDLECKLEHEDIAMITQEAENECVSSENIVNSTTETLALAQEVSQEKSNDLQDLKMLQIDSSEVKIENLPNKELSSIEGMEIEECTSELKILDKELHEKSSTLITEQLDTESKKEQQADQKGLSDEGTDTLEDLHIQSVEAEKLTFRDLSSHEYVTEHEIVPAENVTDIEGKPSIEEVQTDATTLEKHGDEYVKYEEIKEHKIESLLRSDQKDNINEVMEVQILSDEDIEEIQSIESTPSEKKVESSFILQEAPMSEIVLSGESISNLQDEEKCLNFEEVKITNQDLNEVTFDNVTLSKVKIEKDTQIKEEEIERHSVEIIHEGTQDLGKEENQEAEKETDKIEVVKKEEGNEDETDKKKESYEVNIVEELTEKKEPLKKEDDFQKEQEQIEYKEEDSVLNIEQEDGAKKMIEKEMSLKVEQYSEVEEYNEDEALWCLIEKPLDKLQQSLTRIIESPSVMEAIVETETKTADDYTIIECLSDLQMSIAAIQQTVTDDYQQMSISWQDQNLPKLQNLAESIEKLGECLPTLGNLNILTNEYTSDKLLTENNDMAAALMTLIEPLRELREHLGLIVEEQTPYEQALSELQTDRTDSSMYSDVEEVIHQASDDTQLATLQSIDIEIPKEKIDTEIDIKKSYERKEEVNESKAENEELKQVEAENEKTLEKLQAEDILAKKDDHKIKEEVEKIEDRNQYPMKMEDTQKEIRAEVEHKEHAEAEVKKKEPELLKAEEEKSKKEREAVKLIAEGGEGKENEETQEHKAKEEERKNEETDKLKAEEDEHEKKEEAEKLKADEDQRKKQEEADKLQAEEDDRKKTEEAEKLKAEEDQRKKKEEAEKLKAEEDERKQKEEAEKIKAEEDERKKKEEAENLKAEEEERKKKEEAEKLKAEEERRKKKDEAEKIKAEEEERKKKEETEKFEAEKDERKQQEVVDKLKTEEQERKKKEEAEKLKAEEDERKKQEADEKLKAEEHERKKKEEAEELKAAEEDRKKKKEAENEERRKQEQAEKLKAEEEECKKKEETEKFEAEEDERTQQEVVDKLKTEEQERKKKEEAEKLKAEEDERKEQEADENLKTAEDDRKKKEEAEDEERRKQEQAEKLKVEEEERKKKEEAEKLMAEEEARKKEEEAEKLKAEEEERKKKVESEKLKAEEEERKKKEDAEKIKAEEEEREKKEEAEKLKAEEDERKKKEEAEKLKAEEEQRKKKVEAEDEERRKQEQAEKLKVEEEERKKKEEAEKLKAEEEERKKKEEAEKLKAEEEERKKKVESEKLKAEEEERKKKEDAEKIKAEEEEREKKEEAEKLKAEEDERKKKEEAEKLKAEEEQRKKKEEAEKLKAEEDQRKKTEEAEKLKAEEEERKKKEAEKLKVEEDERKKKEEAENLKAEEEERKKKEEVEKLKAEEEQRKKKEEAEKLKAEEEERKKKEDAGKLKAEEEERKKKAEAEKLKANEDERKKKEEAEKLKAEEEEREKKEEAEKLKAEEDERKKKKEAEKLKAEEEHRKKKEEAEKLKAEEDQRKKTEEAEKLKAEEEERKKKEEAEKLKVEEDERKKKEEAENLKADEEERKKKEEAEKLKAEEEQRKKKEEAEKLKAEEEERKKKEEAEKLKAEEEERKKKEEAEKLQVEEDERKKKEEAENLKAEEEERKKKEEAEKLKAEEEQRKKKEEAEKLKAEEEERKKKEEAEKLMAEEEERKKKEVAENLKAEEDERKKKEEVEKLKAEEDERKKKEDAEKLKAEDDERKKKEDEDKLKADEDQRKKKEEADKPKAEEDERKKKEEVEKLKAEEDERKKKEEAEKLKADEDQRKKKEETEKVKAEEEDRKKKGEADKLKAEEEDRKKKEEAEKIKAVEEERKKKEEPVKLKSEVEDLKKKEEADKLKTEENERKKKEKVKVEEEPKRTAQVEKLIAEKEVQNKGEEDKKLRAEVSEPQKESADESITEKEILRKNVAAAKTERKKRDDVEVKAVVAKHMDETRNFGFDVENRKTIDGEPKSSRAAGKDLKTIEEFKTYGKFGELSQQPRMNGESRQSKDYQMPEERKSLASGKLWSSYSNDDFDITRSGVRHTNESALRQKNTSLMDNRIKTARYIQTSDSNFNRDKISLGTSSKFNAESFYNKHKVTEKESPVRFDYKKSSLSDISHLKFDYSMQDLSRLRPKKETKFLSRSREDLLRRDYDLRSSYPSLSSGTSIPDLTSSGRSIHHLDYSKKYNTHSTLSLNLETESKRRSYARTFESPRTDFDHPTYTPKSFHASDHFMSVSDSLALSRSRRRFEARNVAAIYDGTSSTKSTPTSSDRGKCPTFCTKLTNCTVAEGSHVRLICTTIGHPEPQIYWTKNGDRVRPGGRERTRYENGIATLEITIAELEDSGYYACIAKNTYGQASTEATVRVYSIYESTPMGPTFTSPLNDKYRLADRELILETRVRGQPTPSISWLKDERVLRGDRYKQSLLNDGVCRLQISEPDLSDSGQYICKATSDRTADQIRHAVHFDDFDVKTHEHRKKRTRKEDYVFDSRLYSSGREREKLPRISSSLADYKVPAGGTIALQVEIKDAPPPKVTWLRDRGERKEPISSPKIRTFAESGIYTLVVPEATESEAGTYVCRVSNAYGHIDTSATVEVIPLSKFDDLGKPAMFISRPVDKVMHVVDGEAVSVSFRVSGTPKPRVVWMKGVRDITDGLRSHKEIIDDYVRLTLNRVNPEDEGTYCILVKNCYGCDRSFFTLKVRQRARSLTPTTERFSSSDRLSDVHIKEQESYLRNVPGPISSEPIVVDGGRNWLSLSWGKADQRGPAPVIAYRVDAWQRGGDGGARWAELGITPINSFDAFNLRPGGEYKFRVTPRNRYGWGESVTMSGTATVCDDVEIPEFTTILPGQLKALVGSTITLECEVRSDSKFDVKWLRETTEIDSTVDSRYTIKNVSRKCSLVLNKINEDDTGRYICEITNKAGKVSSYGRILVVNDPKILNADTRLKKSFFDGLTEEGPPHFTMRLRDRRVQTSYPVRLTCQVFGCPEPEVTWLKDDALVTETTIRSIYIDESHFHTLEIARANLDDSGTYTACARNANGSVSCRCVLVVDKGIRAYIAPEFLYGLDVAYAVKVGGELRLTAQIEAYPSVGIVWHRDGIRLRPSRRAAMSLSHDGTVELLLARVTSRDAGVYTCTATNEVGKAETSSRVSVIGPDDVVGAARDDDASPHVVVNPPDVDIPYSKVPLFVTKPLSTEAQEGDTVIIQCEVVGDPKPEVMWLRDFLKPDYYKDAAHFRPVGAGPQYSLEIPHAKLDYTGTYSVLARNEHGEAKAIISLQIYAKGQGKANGINENSLKQGNVLSVPRITSELKDIRCCDGDAVTLECKVFAPSEPPNIRWEKSGKTLALDGDFAAEFDGETAKLIIHHVYPEDEGEYTCVATNELGKAFTSACLVVDVPEGKENTLSQPLLTRPQGLLSANSTPRSTPRSTPVRSLSPGHSRGRELKAMSVPRRIDAPGSLRLRKPKICPPKFYAVPHNRVAEEGETVRFQCAVAGHPVPWSTWDKDGVTVTSSARITIKEKDDVRILEIAEVTAEDAGLYRVTLENDVGRTEATARLEIINRNTLTPRPIRTRSASPRTYPTFSRSLLSTTTRLNGRLQLQCDIRGSPSPSIAWFRNGTRIERSTRIRRSFVGERAVLELSNVKLSDAGEYVCEAKNLLGTTRSSCKVVVLDADDPSTKDREPPKFLQNIPSESIVMEGHSFELQARLSGTTPFTILWLKDGHEVIDSDYYRHVVYEDGGVALRFLNVTPLDAGDYTCVVRNVHGEVSCRGLFVVQDYKSASSNSMLSFVKTPVPVFVEKGETACFCARVQSDRSVDIDWTINGKSAREAYRCKIERDGSTSILRIPNVTQIDCGEIRCIASITRGPSISSSAQLRLRPYSPSSNFSRLDPRSQSMPRLKDGSVRKPTNGLSTPNLRSGKSSADAKKRASSFTRLSSKARESSTESVCEKPPAGRRTPVRGKSLEKKKKEPTVHNGRTPEKKKRKESVVDKLGAMEPVEITIEPMVKSQLTIEPIEKVDTPVDPVFEDEIDQSIVDILAEQHIIMPIEPIPMHDDAAERRKRSSKSASPGKLSINRMTSIKSHDHHHNNNNNEEEHSDKETSTHVDRKPPPSPRAQNRESEIIPATRGIPATGKEEPALVLKQPNDVITLRGSKVVLEAAYQGHPEPSVKWERAGRELVADDRIHIDSVAGISRLTLDGITADQAGKYAVSVENALGSDCRFASVAVEGPPEPPCDPPRVSLLRCESSGDYGASVTWCSPAYDGGCALTGYTVECRRIGELIWRAVAENCHSLSHEVREDLRPGAAYLFRVRALNVHGPGEPSPESRPFKVPFADMDDAEDKLKVEEDEACMEDENGEFDDKEVVAEEGPLFKERYALHEELGKGRYGVVRRVIEKKSQKSFAAKFVRTVKASDRQQVREEMKIMNMLRHPKLLRLTAAFESPKEIVMVMEYISGGELFERVVADDFTLTEKDCILFMRQICEGARYMHENKVVHLDLKPENIMCHTRTSHRIKLIDFGLAQILSPSQPVRVLFGTPEFIPPEIINYEPIGTESDMWSVGVICYVLLTGLSPFMGDNDAETFANIVRADYDFEDEAFDAISADAKDFISNLLQKKKELRMSAKQCLSHSWLAQHTENMSRVALPTDKLKKFIVRRKWQKTGNALRALGRMAMLSANRRSPSLSPTSTRSLSEVARSDSLDSENQDESFRKDDDETLEHKRANTEEIVSASQMLRRNENIAEVVKEDNGTDEEFAISSKERASEETDKDVCEDPHDDVFEDEVNKLTEESEEKIVDTTDADVIHETEEVSSIHEKSDEVLSNCETENTDVDEERDDNKVLKPEEIIEDEHYDSIETEKQVHIEETESLDVNESIEEGGNESIKDNKADEVVRTVDISSCNKDQRDSENVVWSKLERNEEETDNIICLGYKNKESEKDNAAYSDSEIKEPETQNIVRSDSKKVCDTKEEFPSTKTDQKDTYSRVNRKTRFEESTENGSSEIKELNNKESKSFTRQFRSNKEVNFERENIRRSFRKFNTQFEAVNQDKDARVEGSPNRARVYIPTGNVSRTAKLFEKLETEQHSISSGSSSGSGSTSSISASVNVHGNNGVATLPPAPTPMTTVTAAVTTTATVATNESTSATTSGGKPRSERIQRAFAFWNK